MTAEGKYKLELNIPGDGRVFINFWDWAHGNDVIAEIIDNKLMMEGVEVSFPEYIKLVIESIEKRTL